MAKPRAYTLTLAKIYPLYLQKVTKKHRTQQELNAVINWVTGYSESELQSQTAQQVDLETFFRQAPQINPQAALITGVICRLRVENIEDPTLQKIRWLDKLVDELAKGWPLAKIYRS